MGKRRSELTHRVIDKGWPHQIALPQDRVSGRPFNGILQFCSILSIAPRGRSFVRDDEWYVVFCFADKEDADLFQRRYGGVPFDGKAEAARQKLERKVFKSMR